MPRTAIPEPDTSRWSRGRWTDRTPVATVPEPDVPWKPDKPIVRPPGGLLDDLTVGELQRLLEDKGLPTTGKKADLIARLQEAEGDD